VFSQLGTGHEPQFGGDQPWPRPQHRPVTLAAEVPGAILAKTLGIHVQAAIQWQKISAGDWTAYAAEVSRRTTPQPGPF
jgi:hypothetical protein